MGAVAVRHLKPGGPQCRRTTGPGRGLVLALVLSLMPAMTSVAAQEPERPPPDTVPPLPDAPEVPADTLPEEEPPPPPPEPVRFVPYSAGWAPGVWEWDREALLASTAFTLAELLERIPGVIAVRSGFFGLPEAPVALGATAGRIEVVLDGYSLDPLTSSVPDFARFELMHLSSVRVERRLDRLRIELETASPRDARPYSIVEAGTGDLATNLFRGIFLAPRVLGGGLGLGVERLSTEGLGRTEPANNFTGWAKWGFVRGSTGVELEVRQNSFEIRSQAPQPMDGDRRDLLLRVRSAPVPGFTAEAVLGRSSSELVLTDTLVASATQIGLRAQYAIEFGQLEAAVRWRGETGLPRTDARLAAEAGVPDVARIRADVGREGWAGGTAAGTYELHLEVGPLFGLRPFAALSSGRRGVPFAPGVDTAAVLTERRAWRAGAELALAGFHFAGAALGLRTDSAPDLGLPFDRPVTLHPGGDVRGWEATARIPLLPRGFALEAAYQEWTAGERWVYLPVRAGTAALAYHGFPLDTRNLEVFGRVEATHRGRLLAPAEGGLVDIQGGTLLNLALQVRVVDVRIFIRWDNILHELEYLDLPGRPRAGQRASYGVKWEFWN